MLQAEKVLIIMIPSAGGQERSCQKGKYGLRTEKRLRKKGLSHANVLNKIFMIFLFNKINY